MKLIDKLSEEKRQKFCKIKETVKNHYCVAKGKAGVYTPHDESHCEKVQQYLDKILPPRAMDDIIEVEAFLLLCSAWLHDIGMIPGLFGANDISDTKEIRRQHHLRSAQFIDDNWKLLGLEADMAVAIMKLCRYHRRTEKLQDLEDRLQFLVALLRLADACHSDYTRAPEDTYRLNLALGISSEHLLHWVKHLIVHRIEPNHERRVIELEAIVPHRDQWFDADFGELVELVEEDLQHELEGIKDCLIRHGGFTFTKVEKTTPLKELSRGDDDWGIFEAYHAYKLPKSATAGEVMDSVLDILHVIAEKAKDDRITERFEKVLSSVTKLKGHHRGIVRLKEDMEHATDGKEGDSLRGEIKRCVKRFRKWKETAQSHIASLALQQRIISVNDCILVYGNSSCLRTLFDRVPNKTRQTVKVYVGELRSKSRYDALGRIEYNDGQQFALTLAKMGYRVSLIADAAIPHFLGRGNIRKVLTGASGIGLDGSSAHPVGQLMVAQSAKQFGISLYILAESFKIGSLEEIEQQRKNLWLCGDYDPVFRELGEHGVEVPTPKQDIIAGDMVSDFITEVGVLRPNEVARFSQD